MLPPDESLHPDDLPCVNADLRLVIDLELIALKRPAQLVLQRESLQSALVHVRRVELEVASTLLLGAIECRASVLQQVLRVHCIVRVKTYADAGRDVKLLPVNLEGRVQNLLKIVRHLRRVVRRLNARQKESELVARKPRNRVALAHRR